MATAEPVEPIPTPKTIDYPKRDPFEVFMMMKQYGYCTEWFRTNADAIKWMTKTIPEVQIHARANKVSDQLYSNLASVPPYWRVRVAWTWPPLSVGPVMLKR